MMQATIEIEYDQIFDLARQLKPWERRQLIRELKTDDEESDGKSSVSDSGSGYIFVVDEDALSKEEREEFRRNHDALVASLPKRTNEEWEAIIERAANFPVATEEEIKLQDEVREEMRRWRS